MGQKNEIVWQDCFGMTKQYTMLMVKSQHEPMRFASLLSKLYQRPFSFIADYAPDFTHPDIQFPTYFSVIDPSKNVNMLVMANRTTVPAVVDQVFNPLQSMSLFDDYFYFFNQKTNKKLFSSPLRNYDFLIFLYSDKDYNIAEVIDKLGSQPSFMMQDVSEMLQPDGKTQKKQVTLLQNLIEYFGVEMNEVQEEKIRARLRNKEIPQNNVIDRRYDVRQTITSPLLGREDI